MPKFSSTDLHEMPSRYRASFVNSISGFKSLFLVGSQSANGIDNLAPFNSIVHIGSAPARLGFIARPETDEHQSMKNIKGNGLYTLSNVLENFVEKAHQCSAKYTAAQSEFDEVGLSRYHFENFKVPAVLEASIRLAMQLEEIIPIALNGTQLVIGRVQQIILPDGVVESDGFINLEAAGSLTCIGVDSYHRSSKVIRLPYAKI